MAWRLICDRGRQLWRYFKDEPAVSIDYDEENPNSSDKIYRESAFQQNYKPVYADVDQYDKLRIPTFQEELSASVVKSILSAVNYYSALQVEDGHWPGDYGGPMFLLPGIFYC